MGNENQEPLQLTDREWAQVRHAQVYAREHQSAGAPGHGQFLLIAKLAGFLEDAVSRFGYAPGESPPVKIQQIAWSGNRETGEGSWRDVRTGVKVEIHD